MASEDGGQQMVENRATGRSSARALRKQYGSLVIGRGLVVGIATVVVVGVARKLVTKVSRKRSANSSDSKITATSSVDKIGQGDGHSSSQLTNLLSNSDRVDHHPELEVQLERGNLPPPNEAVVTGEGASSLDNHEGVTSRENNTGTFSSESENEASSADVRAASAAAGKLATAGTVDVRDSVDHKGQSVSNSQTEGSLKTDADKRLVNRIKHGKLANKDEVLSDWRQLSLASSPVKNLINAVPKTSSAVSTETLPPDVEEESTASTPALDHDEHSPAGHSGMASPNEIQERTLQEESTRFGTSERASLKAESLPEVWQDEIAEPERPGTLKDDVEQVTSLLDNPPTHTLTATESESESGNDAVAENEPASQDNTQVTDDTDNDGVSVKDISIVVPTTELHKTSTETNAGDEVDAGESIHEATQIAESATSKAVPATNPGAQSTVDDGTRKSAIITTAEFDNTSTKAQNLKLESPSNRFPFEVLSIAILSSIIAVIVFLLHDRVYPAIRSL